MPDCAVGLMTRYPQLGRVKTRLAADIGDDEALQVYLELLGRAVKVVDDLDKTRFVRTVFVTPSEQIEQLADEYPGLDNYLAQADGDLGDRMKHALKTLLDMPGVQRAILIGTDIPELSSDIVMQASAALENHDCVFGPTFDGGYFLIGMRRVHEMLFHNVAWGTTSVLQESLAIVDKAGLTVQLLTQLRDLDNYDDLKQLSAAGVINTNIRSRGGPGDGIGTA